MDKLVAHRRSQAVMDDLMNVVDGLRGKVILDSEFVVHGDKMLRSKLCKRDLPQLGNDMIVYEPFVRLDRSGPKLRNFSG